MRSRKVFVGVRTAGEVIVVVTVLVGCTSVSSAAEMFALLLMRVPLVTPVLT